MLFTRAQLQPGENVLVLAAGSGVGSAAIGRQIFRCRVIATAGNEELAKASESAPTKSSTIHNGNLGRSPPAHRETWRGCVVEHVAMATGTTASRACAAGGRWSPAEPLLVTSQIRPPLSFFSPPTLGPRLLHGHQGRTPYRPTNSVAQGRPSCLPLLDKVRPLHGCATARDYLREYAKRFGKVVLTVPS